MWKIIDLYFADFFLNAYYFLHLQDCKLAVALSKLPCLRDLPSLYGGEEKAYEKMSSEVLKTLQ